MSEPKSEVLTREELNAMKRWGTTPKDGEYLLALIEDHLLPVVRAAANPKGVGESLNTRHEAQRIIAEGGY